MENIIKYLKVVFLPLVLAILFSWQNYFFNYWLNISSDIYDTRLFVCTFALGAILYFPALLFEKKFKYIYFLIVSFFISIIFSSQFLYFKYSESFLQFSAIKYLWQAGSIAGTARTLLTPGLFLFFANLFIAILFFGLFLKEKYSEFALNIAEKIIIIIFVVFVAILGYHYLLNTEKKEWGNTSRLFTDVYDLKTLVGKMGIMNFFFEDTFKFIERSNILTAKDRLFLTNFSKTLPQLPEQGKYFGNAKGKNVIIIQVESLENAVINQKIGVSEITPNLNSLAKQGIYFSNYYTQIGPGNTADAEFSTMNSLYPLPDDVVFIDYAKNHYSALPELLKNNGYVTNVMHGDVPSFWNRANIYPGLGYQKLYDLSDYNVTRPVGNGPSDLGDEDLFSQSLPKLKNSKQPFMATLITMSSHTPFTLPDDLETLNIPSDTKLNYTQQQYLQSVHYTDKAIGEFIQGLKDNGLYDNSLILIWGDHGSFTGITKALGNPYNNLAGLKDSSVPLIIINSGLQAGQEVKIPGSHLDIYPTIANLLGIKPPKTILGQDLLNNQNPVETKFNLVSGGITDILTPQLAYEAEKDGVFNKGTCESMPDKSVLPINNCQKIFTEQSNMLKASNIIIRGDLLDKLKR